MTRISGSF